jgi:hypothetical protein
MIFLFVCVIMYVLFGFISFLFCLKGEKEDKIGLIEKEDTISLLLRNILYWPFYVIYFIPIAIEYIKLQKIVKNGNEQVEISEELQELLDDCDSAIKRKDWKNKIDSVIKEIDQEN